MIIWALTDGRIGNTKQTLALANALGTFTEVKITFKKLFGYNAEYPKEKPDLIISSGRKLARVSLNFKEKYKCKNIHILYPGNKLAKNFDYIIIPNHDDVTDDANIIKITGSVTAVNPSEKKLSSNLTIAVLLGNISTEEAENLVIKINKNPALYLITTSRRTNPEAIEIIEKNISQIHKLYKYGSSAPNPYERYFTEADIFIVSGDSSNMITEAAHSGKPVYILEVDTKDKFKKLWADLYERGIARKLENKLESWDYTPLDNLANIKKSILTT